MDPGDRTRWVHSLRVSRALLFSIKKQEQTQSNGMCGVYK